MNTAKANFTDNCLIRTHHRYGQFALSLGDWGVRRPLNFLFIQRPPPPPPPRHPINMETFYGPLMLSVRVNHGGLTVTF